jgi:hypothetical protein
MSRPLRSKPLRPEIIESILSRCQCGKVPGASLPEAKALYRAASQRSKKSNPVRYYQCTYGAWHWTSVLVKTAPDGHAWLTRAEKRRQAMDNES